MASVVALLVGAGGAFGLMNLSSSDETGHLQAELEAMRKELADAKSIIDADCNSQVTTVGLDDGSWSGVQPLDTFRDCSEGEVCPEMVLIPPGKFTMGSPMDEEGRDDDEGPQHEVKIGASFAIGKFEVTFEEYDRFAEPTGKEKLDDRGWGRGQRPVINVSW
jgi:formylglycine-generating enzyme required for sulfatase activity